MFSMFYSPFFVLVEATSFLRPLEDVQLNNVGLEAVFECEISKPEAKAEWFKGDQAIKRSVKYNTTSKDGVHTLTISECQNEDIASYTIKVDGASSTAKLSIAGTYTTLVIFVLIFSCKI